MGAVTIPPKLYGQQRYTSEFLALLAKCCNQITFVGILLAVFGDGKL